MVDKAYRIKNDLIVANTCLVTNAAAGQIQVLNSIFVGNSSSNTNVNSSITVVANTTSSANLTPQGLAVGATIVNSSVLFTGNTTANLFVNSTMLAIANSTASANINSSGLTVGTTVVNTSVFFTGNSTVNTTANSTTDLFQNSTVSSIYGLGGANVGANLQITTTGVSVGNSSINLVVNSLALVVGNTIVNSAVVRTGNTTNYLSLNTTSWSVANSTGTYTDSPFVLRNKVINGCMDLSNYVGANSVPSANGYVINRWQVTQPTGKFGLTGQQNQGAITPPGGFSHYYGFTTATANTVSTTDVTAIFQPIEGSNMTDFGFGTSAAQSITLSFQVRSSLNGTWGGAVQNGSRARSYPFSYTINNPNTWEYKTVTIPGDTAGTWATDNTVGMYLTFSLGCGPTVSTTAGAWAAGDFRAPTGATSLLGTLGATWNITGIQLEKGTTATPIEYRLNSHEVLLASRYYATSYAAGTIDIRDSGQWVLSPFSWPITLRVAPSITWTVLSSNNANVANPVWIANNSDGGIVQVNMNSGLSGLAYFNFALAANAELA